MGLTPPPSGGHSQGIHVVTPIYAIIRGSLREMEKQTNHLFVAQKRLGYQVVCPGDKDFNVLEQVTSDPGCM